MSAVPSASASNPFELSLLLLNHQIQNSKGAEQKKFRKAASRVEECKQLTQKIIDVIKKISHSDTIRNGAMPADKLQLKNCLQELESNTRASSRNSDKIKLADVSGSDLLRKDYKTSLKDLYCKVKDITEKALIDVPSCKDGNKVEELFEDSCSRIFALREELKKK